VRWRLLEEVPEEGVLRVLTLARRRRFARGDVVFHRDDPADSLHLVVSGRFAARVITPLGDAALVSVHGPGDAFGELALVGGGSRRSATVSALEPAETRCVSRDDFVRLRREHPGVDAVLCELLAAQVRSTTDRLVEAHYVDAETRLRRRLCELAKAYGGEIALTQQDLAEMAGTSRATVNRVLREEQARGTVSLGRGHVAVAALEELTRRSWPQNA
jgi:CRP/FNR family transcriptional regulator, cyclic AMP receptor protein